MCLALQFAAVFGNRCQAQFLPLSPWQLLGCPAGTGSAEAKTHLNKMQSITVKNGVHCALLKWVLVDLAHTNRTTPSGGTMLDTSCQVQMNILVLNRTCDHQFIWVGIVEPHSARQNWYERTCLSGMTPISQKHDDRQQKRQWARSSIG